jgi:hypothetical protein
MVAVAGDVVNIRGGTYRETVSPFSNGTNKNPITFQAYKGETVVVSGANIVTGWSQYSGNIYKASVTLDLDQENQVFVNSSMANYARWPNVVNQDPFDLANYANAGTGSSDGVVHDTNLPSMPDNYWKDCVIWTSFGLKWSAFGTKITSSNGQDLHYTTPAAYDTWFAFPGASEVAGDKELYYLTGKLELLDTANEWYYDSDSHNLYIWVPGGGNPDATGYKVEVKKRDFAFILIGNSNITIKNIQTFGTSIYLGTATNCILDGINAKYLTNMSNVDGLYYFSGFKNELSGGINIVGNGNKVKNCTVKFSAGTGIAVSGTNNEIDNNDVEYCGYLATYSYGISVTGNGMNNRITRNKVWYTGNAAIAINPTLKSDNSTFVMYNDVAYGDMLGDDRGGINGEYAEVCYNWVHDIGQGLAKGYTPGLYTDLGYGYTTYHHNIVYDLKGKDRAVRINDGPSEDANKDIYVFNNTAYNTNGMIVGGEVWTEKNNYFSNNAQDFVNADQKDFHLATGSAAINTGEFIKGITDGYNGSKPNIGAYESSGSDAVSNWKAGRNVTMYYLGNGEWINTNAAKGKTASSDSNKPGNGAAKANDGDTKIGWKANDRNPNHWWKVDLGRKYNITGSQTIWELNKVYSYKIDVSSNGTTWTNVVIKTGTGQTDVDSFTAKARYVRITVTGLPRGCSAAINEFSILTDKGVEPASQPTKS